MNRQRILVVEDESVVAMDLDARLTSMGYQVVGWAMNGAQALALAEELGPDLVLMDIMLQGEMDGIRAAEEIRRRFRAPVIFLTAYSEDATLQRAKLAEPFGYLLKPFEDRELKSAMEIALYKHRAEEEIRRFSRLYDVLSQINQMVVRSNSRDELLAGACRFLVERGAIDAAWIGWLDQDGTRLAPVACFGQCGQLLAQADFPADRGPAGWGDPGQALAEGKPHLCAQCGGKACLYAGDKALASPGFQSCASFPLTFQGRVSGALCVCVRDKYFFGEREVALLKEVAGDISFALDKIEGDAQRERLQQELDRRSRFLQALIEAMPYPVYYKDAGLRYLGCNQAYERFTGLGREQLAGKTVHDIWPTDLAEAYERADRELLADASAGIQVYEARLAMGDGRESDVLFHKSLFCDPDGGVGGIIGALEDITERKLAETTLRESERRFRQVVEAAPEGIFIQTRQRFAYLNPAAIAAFGAKDESELLGRLVIERFHPADHPDVIARIRRLNEQRQPVAVKEKRALRCDGGEVDIEVMAVPFTYQGDDGALVFMRDISARKSAEEAQRGRRELQEQLVSIAASVPGVIYSFMLRPDGSACLPFSTPAIESLFGFTPEMLAQSLSPWAANLHPDDAAQVLNKINEVTLGPRPRHDQYRYIHPSKGLRWIEGWSLPKTEADGNLIWHGFAMDVTERKQMELERDKLESQLHQAQKMEAIGTLAGGIAHDFNNILSAITGYAELARDLAGQGGDNSNEVEQVMAAAERAGKLVRQILTFSRKAEPERRPMNLNKAVERTLKMLESALPKMITIQTKLAGDLCPIAADLTQMEQMVMNLATNAADAMDQGGTLVMETNRERARGQICLACGKAFSGEYAVLTVADMGQGIEADTRERIFEPFFTTKELGKGTGLGLSTVYGVVKVHGGHIQCQSQVGVGTTFKIFLPCHEEKAAVLKAGNGRIVEPKGGSETILLVEDEVPLRALGERFLRSKGYQVLTAPSGEEALELYRVESAKVDLVVLDLSMPGMGGRRCLKELLALDPGAKVVIASGYAGDGQIKDALKSGALAYVAKPFRRAELLTTIREVLDRATPPA